MPKGYLWKSPLTRGESVRYDTAQLPDDSPNIRVYCYLWKSPFARGESVRYDTAQLPDDSPNIVTRPGSPPNSAKNVSQNAPLESTFMQRRTPTSIFP